MATEPAIETIRESLDAVIDESAVSVTEAPSIIDDLVVLEISLMVTEPANAFPLGSNDAPATPAAKAIMMPSRLADIVNDLATSVTCDNTVSVVPPMVVTLKAPAIPVAPVGALDQATDPERVTAVESLCAVNVTSPLAVTAP